MTYNVFGGTLNLTQPNCLSLSLFSSDRSSCSPSDMVINYIPSGMAQSTATAIVTAFALVKL